MACEAAVDAGEFDAGRWSRKSSSLKGGSASMRGLMSYDGTVFEMNSEF